MFLHMLTSGRMTPGGEGVKGRSQCPQRTWDISDRGWVGGGRGGAAVFVFNDSLWLICLFVKSPAGVLVTYVCSVHLVWNKKKKQIRLYQQHETQRTRRRKKTLNVIFPDPAMFVFPMLFTAVVSSKTLQTPMVTMVSTKHSSRL